MAPFCLVTKHTTGPRESKKRCRMTCRPSKINYIEFMSNTDTNLTSSAALDFVKNMTVAEFAQLRGCTINDMLQLGAAAANPAAAAAAAVAGRAPKALKAAQLEKPESKPRVRRDSETVAAEAAATATAVLNTLRSRGDEMSTAAIAGITHRTVPQVREALNGLVEQGLVTKEGNTRATRYTIAEGAADAETSE